MSDRLAVPARLAGLVATLRGGCESDDRIRAAWLGGSLASGLADDWSDVDLHLVVADLGDFPAWPAELAQAVTLLWQRELGIDL